MIVMLMGTPYKFSTKSWKKFLQKWEELQDIPNIELFATRMTTGRVENITDWGVNDVTNALEELAP
jgi:hypothetical protein